jgi:nicotinate-nucleotide adenylyltransferase
VTIGARKPGTTSRAGPRRSAPARDVGLLGGSFNPPHIAHLMAAYWALATQDISEVWLLPSYKHPFGKVLAPFDDRLRMCELAAATIRGVHVCAAEAELADDPLVGRTARTLEHLATKHPSVRFSLIVGTDVLTETDKWYRWDRVTELAKIIVVGRGGHASGRERGPLLPAISSSEIRERLRRGGDVTEWVPRRVLEYATERRLYV